MFFFRLPYANRIGADVSEVAHVMGSDNRIGSKFLQASVGFGTLNDLSFLDCVPCFGIDYFRCSGGSCFGKV
jgi:hypothetical protein